MNRPIMHAMAGIGVFLILVGTALAEGTFVGRKKCYNCHKSQGESWEKTLHAKAIESLKPNTRKEAKLKAKLDPKKDYTKDKDCIGCHGMAGARKAGTPLKSRIIF